MPKFRLTDEERASLRRDMKIDVPALERFLTERPDLEEVLLALLKARPTPAGNADRLLDDVVKRRRVVHPEAERVADIVMLNPSGAPMWLQFSDPQMQALYDAIFASDVR